MPHLFTRAPASAWSVALSLLPFAHISSCLPGSLSPRASTVPAPISFASTGDFEGIDGSWDTFALQVGNPAQTVRVMISTASQQQWVIDPRGCPNDNATVTTCADSRGETFSYADSTSWDAVGLYQLYIEENLGLDGNANYGYDTVTLGYPGEGGPTLQNQTIGVLGTDDFYFGHFGINPKPTNFTNFTSESPSFLTDLKDQGLIPSVSWGYTTGVPYRFAKVQASLTLGGYDTERFVPNSVSFPFNSDNSRDILVSISGINSVESSGTSTSLFSDSIYSYIDSTVAEIWLPVDACQAFEKAFGLTFDETSELYLVSDDQHTSLLASNPNITFTIAPYTKPAGQTVEITLPYAAFDQTAQPPYQGISSSSRYFPLRRAANDTQYTLGRTFLQEAYLTVDWERQNFSVQACDWSHGTPSTQNIVAISSYNDTKSGTSSGGAASSGSDGASKMSPLSTGAIAGIAVGAFAILAISIAGVLIYLRRKQKQQAAAVAASDAEKSHKTKSTDSSSEDPSESAAGAIGGGVTPAGAAVFQKAELDASEKPRAEASGGEFYKPGVSAASSQQALVCESDSKEREVFEMMGDMPARQEADGRILTEKDAMRRREERFNGTDPGVSPVTPNGSSGLSQNGDRSPVSTSGAGTLSPASAARGTPRTQLGRGDIVELAPLDQGTLQLVSPLEGSDGIRTMMFPGLSPLSPEGSSASNGSGSEERKRFSYEDE